MPRPLTREQQPSQTELRWVLGSPEGIEYAPAGSVVVEQSLGLWYRKTTPVEYNTGWQIFSGGGSGGGIIIRDDYPSGVAQDGTIWIHRINRGVWYYDAVTGTWETLIAAIPGL